MMNITGLNAHETFFGFRRMFYLVTPWETRFEKLEDTPNYLKQVGTYLMDYDFSTMLFVKRSKF